MTSETVTAEELLLRRRQAADRQARYCQRNKEKVAAAKKAWRKANPEKQAAATKRYRDRNAESVRQKMREYLRANPELVQLNNIRERARRLGLPFDLTIEDIRPPQVCPVLGIKLARNVGNGKGGADNSPSVDRIVPERGYVKGNVVVVSFLANRIKSNATPGQIRRVADFYEQLTEDSHDNDDSRTMSGS